MALGSVSMTNGDMDAARKWLTSAAESSADRPAPWLAHGRLELAFGDKEVGRSALRRAMELGDEWEARASLIADELRGDPTAGISPLLLEWTKLEPLDTVELRRRGDLRLRAGDSVGAVDDFLAAMRTSAHDLSVVAPLVRGASMGRRIARALMATDAMVHSDPTAIAAWMTSGLLNSLIGDHSETVRTLQAAESLGAELGSGTRTALARAQNALAETVQRPSPGRVPNLGDPISRVLVLVEEKAWDEGERLIQKTLLDHPDDPRLMYIMGQIYLERDGPAAATPWVEQVLERVPDYAPALNLWAWIHAEQGLKLPQAEVRAREALQQQPQVGGYWDTLGWALVRRGKYAEALPILERAVRLSPKDEAVRAHRDSCRAKGGDTVR
jgi:tetratricopeptide (TPR) repeat protein